MILKDIKYKKGIVMPIVQPIPIVKLPEESSWWNRFKSKFKRKFLYKRKWDLIDDYIFYVPWLDKWIMIPKSFKFDFASVPKILNGIYGSTGLLLYGSLVHDFGYKYSAILFIDPDTNNTYVETWSKSELDQLFNQLNEYETNMKFGTDSAYFGLVLFGSGSWDRHRKNNCQLYKDYENYYEI